MFSLTTPTKKKKVSTTIYVQLETVIFLLLVFFSVSFYSLFSLSLPGWRCRRTNPSVSFRYIFFSSSNVLPITFLSVLLFFLSVCLFFSILSLCRFILFIYLFLNTPASCETRVPPHNKPDVSPQLVLLSIREKI